MRIDVTTTAASDTDNTVQAALDAVSVDGGGTVLLRAGLYPTARRWFIDSNTHLLLEPGAVVRRTAEDFGLSNRSDGTRGGYTASQRIKVSGGVWDGAGEEAPALDVNPFGFGHIDDLVLEGITMRNLGGTFHFAEINATRRARVLNCVFDGHPGDTNPLRTNIAEMLQLDLARSAGAFAWFGPYDFTPCSDVLVQGCTFRNGQRGVGSHSQNSGYQHRDVRIVDNHFEELTNEAIAPLNYAGLIVKGNTAREVCTFFHAAPTVDLTNGLLITDNHVVNERFHGDDSRGIWLSGGSVAERQVLDVAVNGNRIYGAGRFGISLDHVSGFVVGNNLIRNCGQDSTPSAQAAGISIWRSVYGQVVNNRCNGNGQSLPGHTDIMLGAPTGLTSDTASFIVADNRVSRMQVGYTDTLLLHDNNVGSELTFVGAQNNYRAHHNFVRGLFSS